MVSMEPTRARFGGLDGVSYLSWVVVSREKPEVSGIEISTVHGDIFGISDSDEKMEKRSPSDMVRGIALSGWAGQRAGFPNSGPRIKSDLPN